MYIKDITIGDKNMLNKIASKYLHKSAGVDDKHSKQRPEPVNNNVNPVKTITQGVNSWNNNKYVKKVFNNKYVDKAIDFAVTNPVSRFLFGTGSPSTDVFNANNLVKSKGHKTLPHVMKTYYPEIPVKPTENPSVVTMTATPEQWYKSSFVNKDVANQAYQASQQARSKGSTHLVNSDGFRTMNTWFPMDVEYNAADNPNKTTVVGTNAYGATTNWFGPQSSLYGILGSAVLAGKGKSSADQAIIGKAIGGSYTAGPHITLDNTTGAVPFDPTHNMFYDNYAKKAVGRSDNVRDIAAHEFQHEPTIQPASVGRFSDTMNMHVNSDKIFPDTGSPRPRHLYSLNPEERNRALHSMKAMTSDLSGRPISNFDEAKTILRDQGLIKPDPNAKDKAPRWSNYIADHDKYEELLGQGKIKPTDMSMIEDTLRLDELMRKVPGNEYYNYYRDYAEDPRTGESVDASYGENTEAFWDNYIQQRFEEAHNTRTNTPYSPYSLMYTQQPQYA